MTMNKFCKMLRVSLAAGFGFFLFTVAAYWFNLDTKLVKALEKPLTKHYDNLPRDRRL